MMPSIDKVMVCVILINVKLIFLTFDLNSFLENVYRVTKNSIVIFCGKEQFSTNLCLLRKQKRHCTSYYLGEIQSVPNEWAAHLFKWCRNGSFGLNVVEQRLLMLTVKIQFLNFQMVKVNCIQQKRITSF